MSITHLLYLHGFRSSPQSTKARMLGGRIQREHPHIHWWCPQLPPSPQEAMKLVMDGIAGWPRQRMAVLGSSLGGFYATWVAQQTGCPRAVLLNPAVDPARDLAKYIGEQTAWHNPEDHFFFRAEYVDELRALHCAEVSHQQRYFAIIAKGDEVLDWREMAGRYPQANIKLLPQSDHAISDFDQHMDEVIAWLNLAPESAA